MKLKCLIVELRSIVLNTDEEVVDLTDFVLHDDKGADDKIRCYDLCRRCHHGSQRIPGIAFGIGIDITATLLGATAIPICEYKYTTTPTPGEANVYTEFVTILLEEQL